MSIITDALKKAEQERKGIINIEEDWGKTLNHKIVRAAKKETGEINRRQPKPQIPPLNNDVKAKDKTLLALLAFGVLVLATIVFLTIINAVLVPSPPPRIAMPEADTDTANVPPEAEAYTDFESEVALVEERISFIDKMSMAFKRDSTQDEFLSHFVLSGIVYDVNGSWAIINDEVVRVGDTLSGARIIAIDPEKVVLLFRDEKFNLNVE